MDGKQARRTGSSSPLGQLFDHGCDAVTLALIISNLACSMGQACGWKLYFAQHAVSNVTLVAWFSLLRQLSHSACVQPMIPWMLAHWEEYHTGVMLYGNGSFGVLEANYSIAAIHILSAMFGVGLWQRDLARITSIKLFGSFSAWSVSLFCLLPCHITGDAFVGLLKLFLSEQVVCAMQNYLMRSWRCSHSQA
jgi:ethanolaminephosphotransferase